MGFKRKRIEILSLKKFCFILIIIINLISNSKCKNDIDFNSKDYKYSIYFSDIDPLSSLDFDKEMERPHKIDTMVLKIEKIDRFKENFDNKFNYYQHQKKSKTFLNLKLAKNFYDINFCVDEIDSPNKNQIFKDLYKIKLNKRNTKLVDYSHKDFINVLKKNDFCEIDPISYNDGKKASRYNTNINSNEDENDEDVSEIQREFEKCFKKFEFLNEDSPRFNMLRSENFNLIKILNQTSLLQKENFDYTHPFDEYLDVKLGLLMLNTKTIINQLIKWEDQDFIIEINFKFDNSNLNQFLGETEEISESKDLNKLQLEKIFVYFNKMPKLDMSPEMINLINSENNFVYDENKLFKNKFNLKDSYISLIQTHRNFENILIDYKLLNKQVKYSKSYLDTKKPKLSTKSLDSFRNKTNPIIKSFSTLQRESIFHNRLTLELDLDMKTKEIIDSNKNNKICILIYQHLTEDTYIEKNELKSHLNSLFNNEFEKYYFFSDEIDQEVSSDISKQYFTAFAICSNAETFRDRYLDVTKKDTPDSKLNKLEISFPIHFRYQPPLYLSSHQEVFLNLPLVDILIQEDRIFSIEKNLINSNFFNENIDLRKALTYKNNRKQILNTRKLFQQEIVYRVKYLNELESQFQNLSKIRHFIPAGRMEHLYYVMIITFIVTLIGFFIIVFGIINNKIKEKIN